MLIPTLIGSSQLNANQRFESEYRVGIRRSDSYVSPPSIFSNFWKANTYVHFDNGLKGSSTTEWNYESQAKQKLEFTHLPSGFANILPTDNYQKTNFSFMERNSTHYNLLFILFLENSDYSTYTTLSIDNDYDFTSNPKIVSVTENVEPIPHWFYNENNYIYLIELDNGKILSTKPSKNKWKKSMFDNWKEGVTILAFGNSKCLCLLNVDKVKEEKIGTITKNEILYDLELIN